MNPARDSICEPTSVKMVSEAPGVPSSPSTEVRTAALKAWRAWRKDNKGPLEEVLQNPAGYSLYKAMKSSAGGPVPNTFQQWLQQNEHAKRWLAWRQGCPGQLREVLADPEGWRLFSTMKREKGQPVPDTYEEWRDLPEHKIVVSRRTWSAWRRAHPGPLAATLADPEGWALYRQIKVSDGKDVPERYEDWVSHPTVRKQAAMEAWTQWRHEHPGQLAKVLADPQGWTLYKAMVECGDKRIEATYEEWMAKRDASPTSWAVWRKSHRGPLNEVLKDPAGWAAFTAYNTKKGVSLPATYEEWVQLPEQQKGAASFKWSSWRKTHKGPLAEVLADPEGWALYVNMLEKGSHARIHSSYAEWLEAYRAAKSPGSSAAQWRQWRKAHEGPLEQVLADPEGWKLYAAHMQRGGRRAFPGDFDTWLRIHQAEAKWIEWRRVHSGPLNKELADPEGWELFRLRSAARGNTTVPATYAEWMKLPEQQVFVAVDAWAAWRQTHPGPLKDVLQADGATGWVLYRAMLRAADLDLPDDLATWLQDSGKHIKLAWQAWRDKHKGPLRRVLADPLGWVLFKNMVESSGASIEQTFEEWAQSKAPSGNEWINWRRAHKGPLHEVLQDPEGWKLYRENLVRKNVVDVPQSFEDFLQQPDQQKAAATSKWSSWRRVHRGPLVTVLADKEGWQLYVNMMEKLGHKICSSFEEWSSSAQMHKGRAAREWRAWRRVHKGPLTTVLADPDGWDLYKAWTAGASNRMTHNSYEEWCIQKEKGREWRDWRTKHPGQLRTVLADPEGWELFRKYNEARNRSVPARFAEWLEQQQQQNPVEKEEWLAWRQNHAGKLSDVLADPEGWKLYRKMKETAREPVAASYVEWLQASRNVAVNGVAQA
ncbi:hypothetical protein TGRUB_275650 [Toxoplasma gondii RUB]|uniref:p97 n=9 Tax=Toxoplasma gondii TaxID=5811 RepID=O15644_TOXGO|nr:p97 [Toxoplasma gondii]EPR59225.1 hypothetical protein TGGT1_275650 [Toxoplasma gondii GT1]KFG37219.1 hypothetical protein TGFOU_275650 [Toxoplasma gondii FOU]KFG47447.1 hypothetical protein TGP89_275650 [Toxoplasma gondii p89]KFG57970.1 hypothetical protein TGRUB_275650 [Toxoplasma gondii RUB]KFH03117.1 hypothetical protein TGMAS_275650 [Toxoplasma gondii MAS]KFH06365.1 hypothetical protein TGVAND_275650 [Toxoplasma gondii VAND]KYF38811.1 hypothetical protein TGARI_275650 [Toxoplasma gon